jgi:hypothetical protein
VIFSSEHHTWEVEPWTASSTAVKVTQLDDDDCVVALLRDREEVVAFTEALYRAMNAPHGDVRENTDGD